MTGLSPLLTTESIFSLSVFVKVSKFSPVLVDIFISFELFIISLFFKSDLFHNIMRNSAFIISTILIRISFMTEGLNNVILIIISASIVYVVKLP